MSNLVKAEFHTHTIYSFDSLVRIEDLLATCAQKGIDRIAITDHNEIEGAFLAKELDPERVIVGEEILTTHGEILGYFMSELVPQGLSPMQVIEALKKQNAFISVAHPFDTQRSKNWGEGALEEILPYVDALEVFNARCMSVKFNAEALNCAEDHNLLQLVGSDAHGLAELGQSTLRLPAFKDADGLREALRTSAFEGKLSGSWVHLISTYSKFVKQINKNIP